MDAALTERRRVGPKRHLVMSMSKFSDIEAIAIVAQSRELLRRFDDDATVEMVAPEPISTATETTLDEILRQPVETTNERHRRELAERDARWGRAGSRREAMEANAMTALEVRLMARIEGQANGQRDVALELIADALDVYDAEVTAPLAHELDAMRARLATLEAQCKKLEADAGVGPITLPNVLAARRVQ